MIRIEKGQQAAVLELYRGQQCYFPLIGAVLHDEQDGTVYADEPAAPRQAYVEHAFGFAQLFGAPVERFEAALERYLLVERTFLPLKVRLYGTSLPKFLTAPRERAEISYRQRFRLPDGFRSPELPLPRQAAFLEVTEENLPALDLRFQVVERFWRTPSEFAKKASAVVVTWQGEPASICYSAAEADRRAEIDVLTLPDFRKLGLGRFAVDEFIRRCREKGVDPLWDCFTNNAGSMMLCQAVGFAAALLEYPFFTIAR